MVPGELESAWQQPEVRQLVGDLCDTHKFHAEPLDTVTETVRHNRPWLKNATLVPLIFNNPFEVYLLGKGHVIAYDLVLDQILLLGSTVSEALEAWQSRHSDDWPILSDEDGVAGESTGAIITRYREYKENFKKRLTGSGTAEDILWREAQNTILVADLQKSLKGSMGTVLLSLIQRMTLYEAKSIPLNMDVFGETLQLNGLTENTVHELALEIIRRNLPKGGPVTMRGKVTLYGTS